ncbi:MAG TPA: hypothetical protein VMP01_14655 [Pirellulaceae bacterium]|nr:hypothetical protein [Pirellulaceae bacterium]
MKRFMAWLGLMLIATLVVADDAADSGTAAQKEQLTKIQGLVGTWRGVGQPQRNSTKGSWIESADWAWKFADGGPSLALKLAQGKYFSAAELRAAEKAGEFVLAASSADGTAEATYRGSANQEGNLILTTDKPAEGMPARVSIRLVAGGDRLLVLLERSAAAGSFARLAEVGYTRKGSGFGKGATGPECVVTGGFGSIEVTHMGQKYYVCCSGCRDYFHENPEDVLAEYKARKEEEQKKR